VSCRGGAPTAQLFDLPLEALVTGQPVFVGRLANEVDISAGKEAGVKSLLTFCICELTLD